MQGAPLGQVAGARVCGRPAGVRGGWGALTQVCSIRGAAIGSFPRTAAKYPVDGRHGRGASCLCCVGVVPWREAVWGRDPAGWSSERALRPVVRGLHLAGAGGLLSIQREAWEAPVSLMTGTSPVPRLGRGWALERDQSCKRYVHTALRLLALAWQITALRAVQRQGTAQPSQDKKCHTLPAPLKRSPLLTRGRL